MHRSASRPVRAVVTAAALTVAGILGTAGPAAAARPPVPHVMPAARISIPDAAMLQPQELRGATPEPVTGDHWARLSPPQPCADRPYPSTALQRTDRAVQAMVGLGDRPTVVVEHVALYRDGGAHRYLRDLRGALATCPVAGPQDPRWTVRATGLAGDESMLLELREYLDFVGLYKSTWMVVARTGQAVVVVADAGWEFGNGHEDVVRKLAPRAVARAGILNSPAQAASA